jgi:hypothetical protein
MGLKSSSCHPESSLRRSAISRTWLYKSAEDNDGIMLTKQLGTMTVGVPLTLDGVYGGQLPHPGTICFFLTDAALLDAIVHVEIRGYDADGQRQREVLKMGPNIAVNHAWQSNTAWAWIESITPVLLSNIVAVVDLLTIGTRFNNGSGDTGGCLALPGHIASLDEVSVMQMVPGAGAVTQLTVSDSGARPYIDFTRQVFSPPGGPAGRWFLFVWNPGRE